MATPQPWLQHLPAVSPRRIAVHVTSKAECTIRFGHPWLYEEAIHKQSHDGSSGDLAALHRYFGLTVPPKTGPVAARVPGW